MTDTPNFLIYLDEGDFAFVPDWAVGNHTLPDFDGSTNSNLDDGFYFVADHDAKWEGECIPF